MSMAVMNKPREVEGVLDIYLIRPLGYLVVTLVRRTPVTPNMLSVASVVAAAAAGACYFAGGLAGALGGLAFVLLLSAFDSADGQLARATGRTTDFGRTLDGLCDNFAFLCLYVGLGLSSVSNGLPLVVAVALGLAAGASHSLQSVSADFVRLMYLRVVMGQDGVERERPETLTTRRDAGRREGKGAFMLLVLHLHVENARKQRGLLRTTDRLERAYDAALARVPEIRPSFVARYRETNVGLLKAWAFMATNSHKVGVVAASFVPLAFTAGPLATLGMASFFVYVLFLNGPLLLLVLAQARRDRRLLAELVELATLAASASGAPDR
jgi:phosphatidylglycerophosphate synthase